MVLSCSEATLREKKKSVDKIELNTQDGADCTAKLAVSKCVLATQLVLSSVPLYVTLILTFGCRLQIIDSVQHVLKKEPHGF